MKLQYIGLLPAIIVVILIHMGAYREAKDNWSGDSEHLFTLFVLLSWGLIAMLGVIWAFS